MKEFMKAFDKWTKRSNPLASLRIFSDGSGYIVGHKQELFEFSNIKELRDFFKK